MQNVNSTYYHSSYGFQIYCEDMSIEIDGMSRRIEEAVNNLIEIFKERSGIKAGKEAETELAVPPGINQFIFITIIMV